MNTIDAKTLELARVTARKQIRLMTELEPEPSRRTEWIFDVEVKRNQSPNTQAPWQFILKPVKDVLKGEEYRCPFCKREVRLFQGPNVEWHAEHREREDAERCPGSPVGKTNATPAGK